MDAITTPPGASLEESVARAAEEAIAEEAKAAGAGGDGAAGAPARAERDGASIRALVTVGTTVLAAAIMVGGIFIGAPPRVWAAVAGIAGLALSYRTSRTRNPWLVYAWMVGGIFLIGLLVVLPAGFGSVVGIGKRLREAAQQGDLLRPPVLFQPGWRAILGWIMGCVGFGAGWVTLEMRRPALGLVLPVPVIAFGAISVPKSQQLASGLVALALLAIGLGLLSSLRERGSEDRPPGIAYEVRRGARALPVVAGVTAALYFLSRSNLLFPPPLYDPTQRPRQPRTLPLNQVQDRVLFEAQAKFTGPWKVGTLDVYDGKNWLLPPFSESGLREVPVSGVVDQSLKPAAKAVFTIRGLTGAILPGLANTVGVIADVPNDMKVSFDARAGTLRVTQGQFRPGFQYTVVAAGIPNIEQLKDAPHDFSDALKPYLQMPRPPASVVALMSGAPVGNLYDRLDFIRHALLNVVIAAGQGIPVSVTPARVDDMLTGNHEATPFEIVAAQAMLARWAGIPARIGYGFDKGEKGPTDDVLLVRPKDGALFLEVFFNGFGWLPIIGDPLVARADLSDEMQQFNSSVAASEDVSVQVFIPVLEPPAGQLLRSVRRILGVVVPIAALLWLAYVLWPLPYKAWRRARRRTLGANEGPAARIALAYAEFRDLITDFGYPYGSDPPLMFLRRLPADDEHEELAWLVTRALWGDLREHAGVDDVVLAEELAGALRARVSRAHPWTLRTVAALSRLSIRDPYGPEAEPSTGREARKELAHVA